MEPFIGMIVQFGGNFAPRGWALCDGQLMSIAQNSALFSILGTTYGGDGRTTFALPDLRSRVPIHPGQGPGLSRYVLGQAGGVESVTLTVNNMPSHNHSFSGSSSVGSTVGRSLRWIRWASLNSRAASWRCWSEASRRCWSCWRSGRDSASS